MSGTPTESNVIVPLTGITRDPGTTDYYTRLASPIAARGSTLLEVFPDLLFQKVGVSADAAADWEVVPAADPTQASDRIRSLQRSSLKWWMKVCVQTSPTGAPPRRCVLTARVDDGDTVTVVDQASRTLRQNNDRQELLVFFDGLAQGHELFFDLQYFGGPGVLSFNTGDVLIESS